MSGVEKTEAPGIRSGVVKTPVVQELILEGFMSHEYSRIPLGPGLNVICGPNGAGKSSILLAISVALGQTYTERSRKLSDLIRRGKDLARVSVVFDNSPREGGRKPVPFSRSDTFMLSRYLKKDGSYWYEGDFKEISKAEVSRLLEQLGLNPDNPLIIMHQGMVEEFSVTTPQEKLVMVEESVGFNRYRANLLEAQQRLEGLVGEETSTLQLMENASQTLEYWQGIYSKFLHKKGLLEKKGLLGRELFWSQVTRLEKNLEASRERLQSREQVLQNTVERLKKTSQAVEEAWSQLSASRTELRKFYFALARLERGVAESEATQKAMSGFSQTIRERLNKDGELLMRISEGKDADAVKLKELFDTLRYMAENYASKAEESQRKSKDLAKEVKDIQSEIGRVEEDLTRHIQKHLDLKVSEALLNYQKKNLEREVSEIRKSIGASEEELKQLLLQKPEGDQVTTVRTVTEVSDDLKILNAQLGSLGDVPEEADTIYNNYSNLHKELEEKLKLVRGNKSLVLREVEERKKIWKETLGLLVEEVTPIYQKILSEVSAAGAVRLTNMEDVEEAGLELLIGFRGTVPTVLDAYTQSGGERSVAIMAFLLSLQNRIVSPFRAIDEFDVHMDPRNRESMLRILFSKMTEDGRGQYIVITPSQITVLKKDVNLIFVQNTQSMSQVEGVKNAK